MALGVPTGPMRAPRSNALAFVFQSFIDELAHQGGQDPVAFRLALLGEPRVLVNSGGKPDALRDFDTGRMRDVLAQVARDLGLGGSPHLAEGHRQGRGVLLQPPRLLRRGGAGDGGASGDITLDHVWVVGDVGSQIINPSGAENQVQGAALDGLGPRSGRRSPSIAAVWCRRISIRVKPLRINQVPPVEVHFLTTDHPPTGLGEPALPPVIPALCNAIFAATGKRIRSLPIDTDMLKT